MVQGMLSLTLVENAELFGWIMVNFTKSSAPWSMITSDGYEGAESNPWTKRVPMSCFVRLGERQLYEWACLIF
jgi:hypothetical protein